MGPGLRKAALIAHVSCSVGGFGAIAAFLALAITGIARQDTQIVRTASLGMVWIGWLALLPLSFASR